MILDDNSGTTFKVYAVKIEKEFNEKYSLLAMDVSGGWHTIYTYDSESEAIYKKVLISNTLDKEV